MINASNGRLINLRSKSMPYPLGPALGYGSGSKEGARRTSNQAFHVQARFPRTADPHLGRLESHLKGRPSRVSKILTTE